MQLLQAPAAALPGFAAELSGAGAVPVLTGLSLEPSQCRSPRGALAFARPWVPSCCCFTLPLRSLTSVPVNVGNGFVSSLSNSNNPSF